MENKFAKCYVEEFPRNRPCENWDDVVRIRRERVRQRGDCNHSDFGKLIISQKLLTSREFVQMMDPNKSIHEQKIMGMDWQFSGQEMSEILSRGRFIIPPEFRAEGWLYADEFSKISYEGIWYKNGWLNDCGGLNINPNEKRLQLKELVAISMMPKRERNVFKVIKGQAKTIKNKAP